MTLEKCIAQLKDLRQDREDFLDGEFMDDPYAADIEAIDTALAAIDDLRKVRIVDTENMATVSDEFICKKCGIYLKDYIKVVMDEDNDGYIDEQHYDYEPKYCPECGAKIKDGDAE